MKFKSIYVAATSQHVGKTTSTLGLVSAFNKAGIKVAYSKPVGQNHVDVKGEKVDKDSVLFADLLNFDVIPAIHSPVILARGATKDVIDHPENYDFTKYILAAREKLENQSDIVIYEGTGHVGVGSVVDLSNAKVAKMLDAEVVMIVEGGIGKTIDMLNMCLALFREEEVKVIGVIINKVIPEKIHTIENYVGKWLKKHNIPLLGIIPYDKTLGYPLLWTIARAIKGNFEQYEERGYQKVDRILAGSLIDLNDLENSNDILLVVSSRVLENAISKIIEIKSIKNITTSPISGIVITGQENITEKSMDFIDEYKLPVIRTNLDTYGAVIKISKLEVKINRKTPWKISRAIDLIKQNVNINYLISLVKSDF